MARPLAAVAALCLVTCCGPPVVAGAAGERSSHADAPPTALVAEVRRGFTVNGKPIPPEIFRDFGDGDLADSGNIWVTVNVLAATGSNLYFDDIKQDGGWIVQKKVGQNGSGGEETAYKFVGAAANGLVVVIATYNGGGSGYFTTLHILDVVAARAFDDEGKLAWQVNLTLLRSVVLGDRWDGEVRIANNTIHVVTTRSGPADESGARRTMTILAERP